VRRERVTIRYKGNPEGVNLLVGVLRARGLKVSQDLALNLPLPGQQFMMHRDIVQAYGTLLEARGHSHTRAVVEAAIDDFKNNYETEAEVSLE
jgi:hypothetical protein